MTTCSTILLYSSLLYTVFEVNFQYSSYMVNETDSNLTVCLEKVGDVSIVQDVVIPIDFIEVSNHPLGNHTFILLFVCQCMNLC